MKLVAARDQISSNLKDVDGHFQFKVGTVTEREKVRVGEKPHPNPLMDGVVGVYEVVDTTWWRVYLYAYDIEDMPLIDADKKQDTIDYLHMLRNEAAAAILALEAM
jgi:hypothetical protein